MVVTAGRPRVENMLGTRRGAPVASCSPAMPHVGPCWAACPVHPVCSCCLRRPPGLPAPCSMTALVLVHQPCTCCKRSPVEQHRMQHGVQQGKQTSRVNALKGAAAATVPSAGHAACQQGAQGLQWLSRSRAPQITHLIVDHHRPGRQQQHPSHQTSTKQACGSVCCIHRPQT